MGGWESGRRRQPNQPQSARRNAHVPLKSEPAGYGKPGPIRVSRRDIFGRLNFRRERLYKYGFRRSNTAKNLARDAQDCHIMRVTVAKLKQAVDNLNSEERLELAEYIRWRSRQDDPEWQAEI